MLEHKHLILRGRIRQPKDSQEIVDALHELVRRVKMRVLRPATAVYCTEPGNFGYTGDVLLTTSHMMWHDWDEDQGRSLLQFDCYSCAEFHPRTILAYLQDEWALTHAEWRMFDRNYGIREETAGFVKADGFN